MSSYFRYHDYWLYFVSPQEQPWRHRAYPRINAATSERPCIWRGASLDIQGAGVGSFFWEKNSSRCKRGKQIIRLTQLPTPWISHGLSVYIHHMIWFWIHWRSSQVTGGTASFFLWNTHWRHSPSRCEMKYSINDSHQQNTLCETSVWTWTFAR